LQASPNATQHNFNTWLYDNLGFVTKFWRTKVLAQNSRGIAMPIYDDTIDTKPQFVILLIEKLVSKLQFVVLLMELQCQYMMMIH
jgi:hypothetical protein